jgi:hypothetical protein
LALLIAAWGGYVGWQHHATAKIVAATAAAPSPVIPVSVATAERRDVPIYLTGLGTVQAFNTVTVKTRVDGELVRVAFTEGQDVKAGDLSDLRGAQRGDPVEPGRHQLVADAGTGDHAAVSDEHHPRQPEALFELLCRQKPLRN